MYTITLQDAPSDIPEKARIEAERRFQRTLERALGGPDQVLTAYRAWQTAEDTPESEISPQVIEQARRWITAASRAQNDGFREVGESEAWFEVRLIR